MATYYSAHNAGGGGVGSIIDPFTLQELADNVDAGDLGLVMATGVYTPSVTIDFDNAAACTNVNYAVIRGAAANGDDDGTIATISGASLGAGDDLLDFNVASLNIRIEGLRITAATRYNVNLNTALNVATIAFYNCRIDTATNHGVYNQESTAQFWASFTDCEIDTNGGCGIASSGVGRGGLKLIDTLVHDNYSDGIQDSKAYANSEYTGCCIYDNGTGGSGHGINFNDDTFGTEIKNCVFFNNDDNGINFADTANTGQLIIYNNIFRSNGGYGIDTNGGTLGQFAFIDYNCSSNNTSGHIDINGGVLPGNNNVIADPEFVDETDGAEDFRTDATSPCRNAGLGYNG